MNGLIVHSLLVATTGCKPYLKMVQDGCLQIKLHKFGKYYHLLPSMDRYPQQDNSVP